MLFRSAQSVAHRLGKAEVTGPSPVISSNKENVLIMGTFFLLGPGACLLRRLGYISLFFILFILFIHLFKSTNDS